MVLLMTTNHHQNWLKEIAIQCSEKIINSKDNECFFQEPYKHIVIDNFFEKELATQILNNFPASEDSSWERMSDENIEIKQRTTWSSEFDIPEGIIDAVRIMNSSIFLNAMAKRLGIDKIIPDPYFTGGGLNETLRNGLLDVHVDGNYHDATGLNRRINAILYLNPEWKDGWGGEFGLYDTNGEHCLKKVAPLFNRIVIFDTHDFSFHGLPDPLNFPDGKSRKSLILYYYTKEPRPSNQISVTEPHSALWKKKGIKDKRGNSTRNFR
jgi:Rps23 Pro-64 3,4-dihydroxylase Tpa1-like proline 4-hydroxylase